VKFEWDEAKRLSNIQKHGIDFADLPPLFEGMVYTVEDTRVDYGEDRYITFGFLDVRVVAVAHTDRFDQSLVNTEDDGWIIRIISARKATKNEKEQFLKEIGV
jgi:uncharacterized DUF497 family protein